MKKKQIRIAVIAVLVLVFVGLGISRLKIEPADDVTPPQVTGDAADSQENNDADADTPDEPQDPASEPEAGGEGDAAGEDGQAPEETGEEMPDQKPADQAPAEEPAKAPEAEETAASHTCTLEIRCDTVVDTSKLENEAVIPYVPASGVILAETKTTYTPGESVFDVLKRVTREQGIQMEFREDALYEGAYIEGINYLYEFDGGSLSGWMYKVNEQFPNYGCSKYTVQDNDAIVWMYTCDLGRDVGDNSTW